MESNNGSNCRHRRSPSSDRFLGIFSPSKSSAGAGAVEELITAGDELHESEVFWTGTDSAGSTHSPEPRRKLGFHKPPEKSGILAALPNDDYRKSVIVPSATATPFRSIPKPPAATHRGEFTQSLPCRKFQNSAPMNVPAMMKPTTRFSQMDGPDEELEDDDDDDDEIMLPPHEIVDLKLKSTSSVLEGVGRTLKGRDLRQVRNAVWRQTGFLD